MTARYPIVLIAGQLQELPSGDTVAGAGASVFTGLTDVPSSYSSQALKLVRVNAGETALEFVAAGYFALGTDAANLTGTISYARLSLASGHILVGNGSNNPADVAMSGDATISNTGAITVSKTGGVAFGYFATGTDAANLTGTIASARISGSYTGITGVGTLAAGTWNGSTITVPYGGSGLTMATAHGVLIGAGTSAFNVTTAGTAGQVLTSNGASADPTFQNATGVSDGDKGDITVSSSGATWTIDNDVVTYAKMQNVSATSRVLGRKTSGAGDTEELTFSEVLDFVGSAAQGDILYRNATAWVRLPAGNAGDLLQSGGAGANPAWTTPSAAVTTSGNWTPVLTFGGGSTGITYTVQLGKYVQVGKLVFATFNITLSSKGSSTGNATVSGLPFAANTTATQYQETAPGASNTAGLNGWIGFIGIYGGVANTAFAVGNNNEGFLTNASFANTTRIVCNFTYMTD